MGSLGERFSAGVKAASPTLNMGIGMMFEDRMAAINRAHDEHLEALRQKGAAGIESSRQAFLTEEGAREREFQAGEGELDRTQRSTEAAADRTHAENMSQIRADLQAQQWKDEKYQGMVKMIYQTQWGRVEALDKARDEETVSDTPTKDGGLSEYEVRLAEITAEIDEQIGNAATNASDYMDAQMITGATSKYDDPPLVSAVKAYQRFGDRATEAIEERGIAMDSVREGIAQMADADAAKAAGAEAEAGRVAADEARMQGQDAATVMAPNARIGEGGVVTPPGGPEPLDESALTPPGALAPEDTLGQALVGQPEANNPFTPRPPSQEQMEQRAREEAQVKGFWSRLVAASNKHEFKRRLEGLTTEQLKAAGNRTDILSPEQIAWVEEEINRLLDENPNGGRTATY